MFVKYFCVKTWHYNQLVGADALTVLIGNLPWA